MTSRAARAGEGERTGFFLPRAAALHDPGWGHRDHQGRLRALTSALGGHMPVLAGRVDQREGGVRPDGEEMVLEDLLRVHERGFLERLREAAERAARDGVPEAWDAGVRVSAGSWDAARATAASAVEAALAVARGELRNAFVAGRPPGHGAAPGGTTGFSLLNHVAVAARALQARGLARRVLVVDWDVHRPVGTETVIRGAAGADDGPESDAATADTGLALFSVDEEGQPGGGPSDPRGSEPADPAGLHAPEPVGPGVIREVIPADTPREEYLERFTDGLSRAARAARPAFVLVSAGFDGLSTDPVGRQELTPLDFHAMAVRVVEETGETAGGRVVAVLEGGYEPSAAGQSVAQVLRALAGLPPAAP